MALVIADRVQETTTTTGTGTVTLAGAATGFQSFAAIGDGNTTYYTIAGIGTSEWEVGIGTYTASGTTLSRTTVLSSSNSNSLVTFSAGTKNVFCSYPAGKSVNEDASDKVSGYVIENSSIGATTPSTGAFTTVNLTGTTNQVSSVTVASIPASPSAGNLKTFARNIGGGYAAPAFLNATNAAYPLQVALSNKRTSYIFPIPGGNTTTSPTLVVADLNQQIATIAATSMFTRAPRTGYSSTTTAGAVGYLKATSISLYTLGSATSPAYGGFYMTSRFGHLTVVANKRSFVGMTSSIANPTNVEPSTLTNCIGVGQGAANTNLFIYYGGSAAQTPIDLGTSFPTNTSDTDWYELTLFAPPTSNNTVYYQVVRLNTGDVATGTLTGTAGTVLPANTTFLNFRHWITNNTTAAATQLQFGGWWIETDY
jgi:hypothetical protein